MMYIREIEIKKGLHRWLYRLLDVLGLKAALVASAGSGFQLKEDYLHETGVALYSVATWMVDHQQGLRSAVVPSVPDRRVDGHSAAEQARARSA